MKKNKSEWHPGGPWPWQRNVKTITGGELGRLTMCRRIDGQWQYRNMTDQEAENFQHLLA
jgi:hypothetical protein